MQLVTANCPACGGIYNGKVTSRFVTCDYCGVRYAFGAEELEALGFVDEDGDGYDDNEGGRWAAGRRQNIVDADADNHDSMPEFARMACEEFLRDVGEDGFDSSYKIERGLGLDGSEDIFLIHDDTMFKSGKNGFAITSAGMYCREMGERKTNFTSWDDFARGMEPELDDSYIRQGRTAICYFTDNASVRENELCDLYARLYAHAQRVQ